MKRYIILIMILAGLLPAARAFNSEAQYRCKDAAQEAINVIGEYESTLSRLATYLDKSASEAQANVIAATNTFTVYTKDADGTCHKGFHEIVDCQDGINYRSTDLREKSFTVVLDFEEQKIRYEKAHECVAGVSTSTFNELSALRNRVDLSSVPEYCSADALQATPFTELKSAIHGSLPDDGSSPHASVVSTQTALERCLRNNLQEEEDVHLLTSAQQKYGQVLAIDRKISAIYEEEPVPACPTVEYPSCPTVETVNCPSCPEVDETRCNGYDIGSTVASNIDAATAFLTAIVVVPLTLCCCK